jgi:hypothetical protein
MSLDATQKQLLRVTLKKRSPSELMTLFAAIRANNDRSLLAALAPPKKRAKRLGDPLVRDLDLALKPLLAPAAEKAEMLVEQMAKKHGRKFSFTPKGLADAARRLRAAKLSDHQIRAGAKALVAHLAKLHGREAVV